MNFVAKQPVESALATALAETNEPCWVIDVDKSMLIGANAAGSKAWGLSPIAPSSALVLDSAMPALRTLRDQLAGGTVKPVVVPLTLWTLRGPLSRTFRVRKLALADQPALALVSLASDAPASPTAERQSAPERRYRLVVDTAESPPRHESEPSNAGEPMSDAATLQEIARRIRQGVVASVSTSPRVEPRKNAPAAPVRTAEAAKPVLDTDAAEPPAISSEALAKIAHELRTPLAAIISMSEVITQERFGPLPHERYRGYVRDILDSARHGLTVLDGMIGAEALATGTPELVFSDLDLNAEVEATLATMQPLAERSGARIDAALVSGLPRVIADRRSVRQMLINLVGNSLKHGGPNVRVKVTTGYELAGMVWIAVEDDGVGMSAPSAAAPAKPTTRSGGLGLPLTRKLAQANGATLTIDSAAGKGTLARIVFPKDRSVPV